MRKRSLQVECLEDRQLLAVRFAVIGDWGSNSINADYVAGMIKHPEWDVDLVLTTGDNNYGQIDVGHSDWETILGTRYGEFMRGRSDGKYPLQTSEVQRFFPSVGNHDGTANGTGQTGLSGGIIPGYVDYFVTDPGGADRLGPGAGQHRETESYYDFRWGPIHFFAVDSDHARVDAISETTQKSWLQTTMAASDATWKFVYFHHPPFSSSTVHGDQPEMRWEFADWGADAVFSGHDHTYERISGPQDELPYFVSGLGGRSVYPLGVPTAGSQFRYNAGYGAMRVTVDDDVAEFDFLSINDGLNGQNGGELVDTFTVSKETVDPPVDPPVDSPVVLEAIPNDGNSRPTELNSLAFVFSKDVRLSLDQNDLSILHASTGAAVWLGANSLDLTCARWDLSVASLVAGFYQVTLDGNGIADSDGNLLDGDGDGVPGDSWQSLFLVALPGDANLDGAVDGRDYGLWREGGATDWGHGDFNQDGAVNEIDYALWNSNRFTDFRVPRLGDRVPRAAAFSTVAAMLGVTMPAELSLSVGAGFFRAEPARVEMSRHIAGDVPRLEMVTPSVRSGRRESWQSRHGGVGKDDVRVRVDRIFADELADIMAVEVYAATRP